MADTKISDMTAASALTGAEIVPVVQSGANRRTTTQDIADLVSAATNLAYTASPTGGTVTSDTGTDATLTLADATNAGLMAPAQHSKLAGIASGATANATDAQLRDRSTHTGTQTASTISDFTSAASAAAPVQSVAGRTGAVTIAAADIADSTTAGRAVLTAADAAAQRTALGLGAAATAATTDGITEGSTNLYHTAARVRAAVLTGLSTATNAVIDAADTVLAALGKLQAQITANLATLTGHTSNTSNPHSVTAAQVGAAASGAVTGSGLTMATARLLGRSTASTGAVEEISVGSGLSLSGGTLSASGGGGTPGGSGTELQYRSGASSFGAVTGSSVSGGDVTLAGKLVTAGGPNGGAWWGESSTSGCELIGNSLLYTAAGSITATINRSDVRGFATTWGGAFAWGTSTSDANVFGADTALRRDAAGVVAVTNDTAGTYRDLKLRDLIATGAIATGVTTKTASYTATVNDHTILCPADSGPITITGYACSGNAGRRLTIKKTDSSGNAVTFDPNASETVDGASTRATSTQNGGFTVQVNDAGTAWVVVATF